MFAFLHSFEPSPILFSIGQVNIYWYGLIMVISIMASMALVFNFGKKLNIKESDLLDLSFLLIITGIIGARIYDVFLEFSYYKHNPLAVFKIWEGGLAIHGAILFGLITLIIFSRIKKINFWKLSAILVPALALGQAIGRFGNYFNQELFGKPTNLPWGIPISPNNRPANFIDYNFFHPTFLYESFGSILICIILIIIVRKIIIAQKREKKQINYISPLLIYMLLYSLLRFLLEFIRIDYAPEFFGLRVPQISSIILIIIAIVLLIYKKDVFLKKKTV